jgi:thermitase
MPSGSNDRLAQWQRNRAERLSAMRWLRTDNSTGRPVRYAAHEVLVLDDHVAIGHDVLRGNGHPAAAITDSQAAPGFRRLHADGMDVTSVVAEIHRQAGDAVAGPNHVFLSSPYELGGPYGPPMPSTADYTIPHGPAADASARVAVVDTGVWVNSPLLPSCYQATDADYDNTRYDSTSEGGTRDDDTDLGHANFITGVIMTATSNAEVRIVKVLDADGVCTEAQLASALLALPAIDVINLSLGGFVAGDRPPVLLRHAMRRLLAGKDRVVVAAAGNDGRADDRFWPAAFAGAGDGWSAQVVAVAAHNGTALCGWSNTGSWISIAAPGENITSTYVIQDGFPNGVAQWSGTSFAAPRVAAAIAQRHAITGSAIDALKNVLADAAVHRYGPYPGLV